MKNKIRKFFGKRGKVMILCAVFLISVCFCGAVVRANNRKEENSLYKYYTSIQIHPGDTLWEIASRYCHDSSQIKNYVKELKEINHLNHNEIHAGRYLTVVYYSPEYK